MFWWFGYYQGLESESLFNTSLTYLFKDKLSAVDVFEISAAYNCTLKPKLVVRFNSN